MPKVPQATQFEPEKIKRLAEALRAEILSQETMLDKCAIAELFDEAMGMCDHVSNLLHFIEKDYDEYLGNSPKRNPRFRDPTFRAGGWGEV